ncbi:MAG: SDR family oxidoreductase [Acidimicrobiaceae bacterium]|nr:SDR family oxidoreductase [Acidimicrobiaceae bacterium]
MGSLAGQRVLVTGGTSGIGTGIVEHLCGERARVVFTGRSQERGSALARATGANFVPADLASSEAIDDMVAEAVRSLEGLDGLVLSAAVLHQARVSETSDAEWDELIDVNVVAPFILARACLARLRESRGAIVAIASGTAQWTEMDLGAYSVSKRALMWMAQMLAVEVAGDGVRVNAVCPGDTSAGMTALVDGRGSRRDGSPLTPPIGRPATALDVARAVAFLLSPETEFCSGAVLTVDGAMRAALRAHRVAAG